MGSSLSRSAVLPYGTQIIEREKRERERGRERGRACSNFFDVM